MLIDTPQNTLMAHGWELHPGGFHICRVCRGEIPGWVYGLGSPGGAMYHQHCAEKAPQALKLLRKHGAAVCKKCLGPLYVREYMRRIGEGFTPDAMLLLHHPITLRGVVEWEGHVEGHVEHISMTVMCTVCAHIHPATIEEDTVTLH
jgi:hypothetical protein